MTEPVAARVTEIARRPALGERLKLTGCPLWNGSRSHATVGGAAS